MAVRVLIEDGLAEIVLDRPEVLNSLDDVAVGEFMAALDRVDEHDTRALLLRAEGRGFCAGRDLSTAEPLTEDAEAILGEVFNPLMLRLAAVPVPTFAAVQGACLGVGFGLAMACDVVYAARSARLGSPFARIGCVLDSGGHLALARRVGPHRALELIYTGRLLDGDEADRWGLVNASVDDDVLLETARDAASRVAIGPTSAFRASKRILAELMDDPTLATRGMALEAAAQGALAGGADYVEGMTAFLEKRAPVFTGD